MPAAARATKPATPPPTPVAKTRSPAPARPKPSATLAPAGPAIFLHAAKKAAGVQAATLISSTGDPAEREAEVTAKKIMRMPPSQSPGVTGHAGGINRAAETANAKSAIGVQANLNPSFLARSVLVHDRAAGPRLGTIQRQGAGRPEAAPGVVQEIQDSLTSGDPLPADVRSFMEPRFRADFSGVRIHTDDKAVRLSTRLGARAFTFGKHIFFGRGQFRPNDREGAELLAHELTHTIQQRQVVQRQAQDDPWWRRAGRAVGGAVSSVVEFGESVGWRMLEEFAPELVPIVRQGPVEWFKEKISNAVESVFNTLMAPVRSLTGIASSLVGHFTNLVAWVRLAAARIANGDCGAVTEAAERIQEVFEGLAAPVIDRIKHLADRVKNFFSGLWDRFGAPVWQFLQRIGGAAWERIQQLGRWIWEKTAPIRRVLNRAWTWIKDKLGIGEGAEGQDGILQWVQRKAQSVWDEHIKPFYERYRTQILIVTGVLVLLSPAGPYIAITAAIGGLAAGIRWIRQYLRNREAIVQQRGVLHGVIIPGILGAVNRVSGFLVEKAQFISGKLTEVVGGLNQAMGAVAGSILGFAVGILRWIIDRFQELVAWAVQGLMGLANGVADALDRLRVYLQPVLNVLGEIAQVVGNIMRLPMLLAGRLWNLIPACIRNPFINFFIPLILRQIAFFRELAATPEAWQQTRAQVMELIQQVFRNFDLLGAIRSAFRLVVRALRIPLELMGQLLEKAANAWDTVIAAPLRFIENALKSILQGIGRFMSNILSHLWFGVQGWLLNAVSQSGVSISPPSSWTDLRAVFGFVLDVMGISIGHVIDLIDRRVPGAGRPLWAAVHLLTGALEWLNIAIRQGPRGLWQHLVERLGNLGNAVLESAVGWVMTQVIANVSTRLSAMAASAGLTSVLEAVKAVYNAIQTAIEYMPRILGILIRVFDTVTQLAAGVIGAAAEMVEIGFRMAMPVVIGFLANYAGLGGIGSRIVEIIQDVRQRVDDAILWLIDRAIAAIRSVLNMIRRGVQAVRGWWQQRKEFRAADGQTHSLFFAGEERSAVLKVQSVEVPFSDFVSRVSTGTDAQRIAAKQEATRIAGLIDGERNTAPAGATPDAVEQARAQKATRVNDLLEQLKPHTIVLFGPLLPISFAGDVNAGVNTGGFGVRMSVKPLTSKSRPEGAPPTGSDNEKYAALNERRESAGGASFYIKGHLLNQTLGGPGQWKNLVPLSRSGNAQHERQAEAIVKRTVDLAAIVEYVVVPNFSSRSDRASLVTRIESSRHAQPVKRTLRGIVEAEDWVPATLTVQADILDETLQRRNALLSITIPNAVSRDYNNYFLSTTPRPVPVNLSEDRADVIATLPDIGPVLAARIVANLPAGGRYSSYEQLAQLVSGIGPERLRGLESAGHVRLFSR